MATGNKNNNTPSKRRSKTPENTWDNFYVPGPNENGLSPQEYSEIGAANALAQLRENSAYTYQGWPELKWRGDGMRRALTCGTLLHIIGHHGGVTQMPEEWDGPEDGAGATVPFVLSELRRIAARYDPEQNQAFYANPIHGGEQLYTDTTNVLQILTGLCAISGVVELIPVTVTKILSGDAYDPDEKEFTKKEPKSRKSTSPYTLPAPDSLYVDAVNKTEIIGAPITELHEEVTLKLTRRGADRLTALHLLAREDPRYGNIDLDDPILEYNPALDTRDMATESPSERNRREEAIRAAAESEDESLPLRRTSHQRPTYRGWLWIVKRQPMTFAYGSTGTPPDTVLTEENSGPGSEYEQCGNRISQALFLRPFLDLVLSGGPEGIWTGKPIKPESIHHDIEVFSASSHSGFGSDMVRMSSLAWELFEKDRTPASTYRTLTERFLELFDETRPMGEEFGEDSSGKSDIEQAIVIEHEDVDLDIYEPLPTSPSDAGVKKKERPFGLPRAERVVIKSTSEAIRDAMASNGLGAQNNMSMPRDWQTMARKTASPDEPPVMRCTFVRVDQKRCINWSVGGGGRCELHGGRFLDTNETASLLKAMQVRIFACTARAIDVVADLMENSAQDAVRLRAAETILSRAGLSERKEISVDLGISTADGASSDPGMIIRERLARLGVANREESEIIGGAVPDQPRLPAMEDEDDADDGVAMEDIIEY